MKTFYKIEEILQMSQFGVVGSGSQLYKNIFGNIWKIFEVQNNYLCKFNSSKDYLKIKNRFERVINDLV